jgi:hypothetical protein
MADVKRSDMVPTRRNCLCPCFLHILPISKHTSLRKGAHRRVYLYFYMKGKKDGRKWWVRRLICERLRNWKCIYFIHNCGDSWGLFQVIPNVHQFACKYFSVQTVLHIKLIVQTTCVFQNCRRTGATETETDASYYGRPWGRVVACGTMLQGGRSRFDSRMTLLVFSIDLIFPAALWPRGRLSL